MVGLDGQMLQQYPKVLARAGDVLLPEGERSPAMLVLIEGRVRIDVTGVAVARIEEPGSVLGEMSGLLARPRGATVTAETDTTCRRIEDVNDFCREHPDAALDIARMLAHRLHLLNAYLIDVRRQYADRSDHLGLVDSVLSSLASAPPVDIEPGSDREREPNV